MIWPGFVLIQEHFSAELREHHILIQKDLSRNI